MDVREKLVELLQNAKAAMKSENLSCDIARNMFVVDFMMANGVTVQEWISADDRLPEPFVSVLVNMPGEKPFSTVREGFISNDGIWQSAMFRREPGEVTHWKPMPQPPKGE